eukprot:RCo042635
MQSVIGTVSCAFWADLQSCVVLLPLRLLRLLEKFRCNELRAIVLHALFFSFFLCVNFLPVPSTHLQPGTTIPTRAPLSPGFAAPRAASVVCGTHICAGSVISPTKKK